MAHRDVALRGFRTPGLALLALSLLAGPTSAHPAGAIRAAAPTVAPPAPIRAPGSQEAEHPPAPPPPAPPQAAAPPPPVAPTPQATQDAGACSTGAQPTLLVHTVRRYRCYPDPVRGGHFCEIRTTDGDFVDFEGCEASCHEGAESCPVGAASGASGAACRRCVQTCAENRPVACPGASGWTVKGAVCILSPGTFGLEKERVVPATCPAEPRLR